MMHERILQLSRWKSVVTKTWKIFLKSVLLYHIYFIHKQIINCNFKYPKRELKSWLRNKTDLLLRQRPNFEIRLFSAYLLSRIQRLWIYICMCAQSCAFTTTGKFMINNAVGWQTYYITFYSFNNTLYSRGHQKL